MNVKTLRCHWFDGKGGVSICGKQGLTGDMKISTPQFKGAYCHYCYKHPRIPDSAFHPPEVRPSKICYGCDYDDTPFELPFEPAHTCGHR